MTLPNNRGFSLIELLLAIIIITIGTGITIRVLNNLNTQQEFRSLAEEVLSDMKTARSLAFNAIQDDPCGEPITDIRVIGTQTGYVVSRQIGPAMSICLVSRTIITKDLTANHPNVSFTWAVGSGAELSNLTYSFVLPTGRLYDNTATNPITEDITISLYHTQLNQSISVIIQPSGNMFLKM